MPLEAPETGMVWARVPITGDLTVTVVGDVHTWWSHWTRPPGARAQTAVRCVQRDEGHCQWCEAGYERRARYVVPVRIDDQIRVMEFGRVQHPVLKMVSEAGRLIGQSLRLRRMNPAKNAEILLFPVGHEHLSQEARVDISEFVGNLGRSMLAMRGPAPAIAPASSNGATTPRAAAADPKRREA